MEELLNIFLREIRGIWRYRWRVVVIAWVIALAGWTKVILMPDQFEARAMVVIDTESLAREALGKMIVATDVESRVELVRQTMLSRPNLEEVARETDLDLRVNDPREFEALILNLQRLIEVQALDPRRRSSSGSRTYEIRYRDRSRETAENVVQNLLNTMVESSLVQGSDESSQAVTFLEGRVAEYSDRLDQAERALSDFKRQNVGLIPGEGRDYFVRLQEQMNELESVRQELAIAKQRRDALREKLASNPRPRLEDGDGAVSPAAELERQITEQESKLNQLLLLYTEKHPDVIATRETLKALRGRLEQVGGSSGDADSLGALAYENVQIALNETEVEVAGLEGRHAQLSARSSDLRQLVDTIPVVEAEYSRLVRDYDVIKTQYEDLLIKLDQARIGEGLGKSGGDVEFRVIDPPRAGLKPVAPNRPTLLLAVLVVALGSGVGLAWFSNQARPVFDSREDLYEYVGRPILGTVSMSWSPQQLALMRTERLSVVALGLALFLAFTVVFVFQEPAARAAQALMR